MKLRDLERMVRATFGECPGCGDCHSCRVAGMVELAFGVGVRSGAAGARELEQQPLFEEWDWKSQWPKLLTFARNRRFGDDLPSAELFVAKQHQNAENWVGSRKTAPRRMDWTKFMCLWMAGEIDKLKPLPELQTDLFAGSSAKSSVVYGSSRQASRSAGAMRLLNGGKSSRP